MLYETGKYYHVYNRGAHGQRIFETDENYRYCLMLLNRYSQHYRVSILAYCLMPNHYHLLINQLEGGSIRFFLQTTFNTYTQAFNKMSLHSGTLFQARAKGKVVEEDHYALSVCRYIHQNPVKAKLVLDASEWQYSDYLTWTGERPRMMTTLSLRDGYFSNGGQYREWSRVLDEEKGLDKYLFNE